MFDKDHSGTVNVEEIQKVLKREGGMINRMWD